MKFVTEDDLRILFKREPFTSYHIPPDTRLTPGGRQFLVDRKIIISGDPMDGKQKSRWLSGKRKEEPGNGSLQKEIEPGNGSFQKEPAEKTGSQERFLLKKKTLQASFLEAGLELLSRDVLLAEQVFELERRLSAIGQDGKEEFPWKPCTGFNEENFRELCTDCFDITGFHAQSEKGKEILLLHRLRCCTRELAAKGSGENLNPVINRLSQMICLEYGGKTCQRKM